MLTLGWKGDEVRSQTAHASISVRLPENCDATNRNTGVPAASGGAEEERKGHNESQTPEAGRVKKV